MKKLHTFTLLAAAAAFVASPILSVTNASAASVSFKGYNALNRNTLNEAYSYSKIYYTSDTKITNVKVGSKGVLGRSITTTSTSNLTSGNLIEGESYTALIENSTATDPDGKPLDVLYRVSDVHRWTTDVDVDDNPVASAHMTFQKSIAGSAAELHPEESQETSATISAGDPIIAWMNATRADAIFTVEFCEKGSYIASTDSCTIATNMTSISSAMWDFDVPNRSRNKDESGNDIVNADGWYDYKMDGDQYLHGNEGIAPTVGSNIIYMNQKAIDRVTPSTEQNGYSVKDINGGDFNGIWFGNSIMVTSTGLSGSWSYRYSGRGCGIGFIFGSAVPYEMPKPIKAVDKTEAKVGDIVTYRISQYVPNNYSTEADIVTFMSLWSNFSSIPENHGYSTFRISDSFDNSLQLPAKSDIEIVNENNVDVSNNFTITISGQGIEAVAKNTDSIDFYGHTYTIVVPTVVKSNVTGSPVQNLARTIYTPVGGSDVTISSDPVETKIYHTVVTKYIDDETKKEIAESVTANYEHGQSYSTSESESIPEDYTLTKTPENAVGTVNGDIEVIYSYKKIKNPTTIDSSAGAFIGVIIASVASVGTFSGLKRRR